MPRRRLIVSEGERSILSDDDQVEPAVIVEVADSQPPGDARD